MKSQTWTIRNSVYLTLAALLFFGAAASFADENEGARSNSMIEGQVKSRTARGSGELTYKEFDVLRTEGSREKTNRSSAQGKLSSGVTAAPNIDFWFFDAYVELFADSDRDGYYTGIDLSFDADTNFTSAEVYAVIYLSLDGGPWNEYAETANFNIYGASGDDEYFVESELVSGYPTGDYDILVELFDTFDNSFVASIGPEDTSALSFLPLEDITRDTPAGTQIVVSSGGGGATGWLAILLLCGVTAISRALRKPR